MFLHIVARFPGPDPIRPAYNVATRRGHEGHERIQLRELSGYDQESGKAAARLK